VVTSASDGIARVWNDKGDIICVLKTNSMLMASKWSKDGQYIASGG
jgi:WD40 repeat protein